MTKRPEMHLGHSPERRTDVPRREGDRDPLNTEPASRESECLGRGPIQPMGVVDDAKETALLGGLR